jgi:autotransporter-associated beta strand protein/predicted outer membrane repeat protein
VLTGAGTLDVTVTTVGGTSAASLADRFSYVAAPTVTGISPAAGPLTGGTAVTITGTGFGGATIVDFGTTAATNVVVNASGTQITATSPVPGSMLTGAGTVDVTVTTVGGTSAASLADRFSYVAPPAVTGVSPTAGPLAGGTLVTITGSGFSGATLVDFGTTAATNVVVNSSGTQITATSPAPGSMLTGAGTVDVTVTTVGGTSETSPADQFSYNPLMVTTAADVNPGNGVTSLREAIAYANSNPGNHTITFYPSLDGQTITLTGGELELSDTTGTITISGPGTGQLTIDGGDSSRVFLIDANVSASISGLTIADGEAANDNGGGVSNAGTLTLTNCDLTGNSAGGDGGGIYSTGTLTLTNCTISGNSAGSGGGLFDASGAVTVTGGTLTDNAAVNDGGGFDSAGTLTLSGSTLTGNSAMFGGGIFNIGGLLTVATSTLSGNAAAEYGGGIDNSGRLSLSSSTLSGNSASFGGGVYNSVADAASLIDSTVYGNQSVVGGGIDNLGSLTASDSTIAGNSATLQGGGLANSGSAALANSIAASDTAPNGADVSGSVTANFSLVQNIAGATFIKTSANNITGQSALLATLGNYGGLTQTAPPLIGSLAIAAGSDALIPAGVTTDQRGLPRIVNGTVDIGACEYQPGPLSVPAPDWTSAGLTLTLGSDGNLHVYVTGTMTDVVPPRPLAYVTSIAIASPSGSAANLTINSANGDPIPSGGLTYSGTGGLIKTGAGEVALSGTDSFSGGTQVLGGTMVLDSASALLDGSSLTIGAGAASIFGSVQTSAMAAVPMAAAAPSPAAATSGASPDPRADFSPPQSEIAAGLPTSPRVAAPTATLSSAPAVSASSPVMERQVKNLSYVPAIDAVFTPHRRADGPADASPDIAPSLGAWSWLSSIESSQHKPTGPKVAALDKVLAEFGL